MNGNAATEWLLHHRRLVITLTILFVVILIFVRFSYYPTLDINGAVDYKSNVRGILDGLITTIFVTLFVSVAFWWMRPPTDRIPPGYEIPSTEISSSLENFSRSADEWEYVGHTGRYVRNRILPTLAESSKKNNRPTKVRMVILNPFNDELCKKYSDYRNRSRTKDLFGTQWNSNVVKSELIVTILKLMQLRHSESQIECELGLRNFLSQYRHDGSNDQIIVTMEDPQEPAFRYTRGTRFFDYCKRENKLIWEQSTRVDISVCSAREFKGEVDIKLILGKVFPNEVISKRVLSMAQKGFDDDNTPYS